MTAILLRQIGSTPRLLLWASLLGLAAAGWAVLAGLEASTPSGILGVLCASDGTVGFSYVSALAMWAAMSLAMMLPAAAPMLSVYIDISDAAAARGMAIASPAFLACGYASVWLFFSLAAAALQGGLPAFAGVPLTSPVLAAVLLIVAGLYQFSSVKQACLSKCRRPMTYFMAHWTGSRPGVFRMGMTQGVLCLGCCWALMALCLAAGFMNILWMALLAGAMVVEKIIPQPALYTRALGAGLLTAGVAVLALNWGAAHVWF
jgi:predicted metal-binding membrane protein